MLNPCPPFHCVALSAVAMEPSSLNCNSEHSPVAVIICVDICEALTNHPFIQQYLLNTCHVFITVPDRVDTALDTAVDTHKNPSNPCLHGAHIEDQNMISKFCIWLARHMCDGEKQGRKQNWNWKCLCLFHGFMVHR